MVGESILKLIWELYKSKRGVVPEEGILFEIGRLLLFIDPTHIQG